MNIKKILPLSFFALNALKMSAQNATVSAGNDATGTGGSVAYSIGQVVYTSASSTSGNINQGVQQPYILITTDVGANPDINVSMSVYPNPAVNNINLNVGKQDLNDLSFQLYDVQGKCLVNKIILASETSIEMDEYPAGNYFLKVTNKQSELKSFKIIKN